MRAKKHRYSDMATKRIPCVILLILIIMIPSDAGFSGHDHQTKRILVLNSYHLGNTWTNNIMRGIKSVFDPDGDDINIHIEYMDTKRNPPGKVLPALRRLYELRYAEIRLDAILVSDNNALDFLLSYRGSLFPHVPVVFCGINHFTDSLIDGHKNITGVVESIDPNGTIDLALRLHPKTTEIVFIHDRTTTGMQIVREVREVAPNFSRRVKFTEITDVTGEELKAYLRRLPDDAILLSLPFFQDRAGVWFSEKEYMHLITESRDLPIYSMWEFGIGLGVLGGIVTNGETQGITAARMVVKILRGEPADNIPILRKSPNIPMFDNNLMKRFGLTASDLPPESIIINKPPSFYGEYKRLAWMVAAIFVSLILFIVFLVVNILRRKSVEKKLRLYQDHLEELVNQRTADLSRINEQLEQDITEHKRTEEALIETEERFRLIAENANTLICEMTVEGKYIYANPAHKTILGYEPGELLGRKAMDLFHPDDTPDALESFSEMFADNKSPLNIWRFRNKQGKWKWLNHSMNMFYMSNGEKRVVVVSVDVTKLKRAEKQIQASLCEKEILLDEVNHRVKNNLQIISSLFDLSCQRTNDQQALNELTDARARIHSMAMIHGQLYQNKLFTQIDMKSHLHELINYLSNVYSRGKKISSVLKTSSVSLSLVQAAPCSLVLNELISNVFKHAFRGKWMGMIEITMRKPKGDTVFLSVKDDGVGIQDDIDIFQTNSLGLKLARTIVQNQLMGEFQIIRNMGTEIIITFKILKEA